MGILTVGTGLQYSTLSAAVAASHDGDVIQVQAGTYTNDFATITTNITIEGIGGMVNLVATEPLPNEKGILIVGTATSSPTVTLNNIEFSGAAISDNLGGNGAGIRYQAGNLTINDCYFHDNQDGLLADADSSGAITITNTEFADNGTVSGLTHNIYIGAVGSFTITGSYITAANTGNEIQSRALVNTITNNRIVDGPTATASYSINLPNGGVDTVTGNTIEQGPNSQNNSIIAFGGASPMYAGSSLDVSNNTILNDKPVGGALAILNFSDVPVGFSNNSVFGLTSEQISSGPVTVSNTTFLATEPSISSAPPFTTLIPVCFCAGTLIATPTGELPVEQLTAGDVVLTHAGKPSPIVWIGIGRIRSRRGRRSASTPVIVRRGALGDNVPRRDLHVTKGHALYLDDALIPVEFLINHRSIVWDDHAQDTVIYHIELSRHDVLLADGAPVESYRDDGNRWLFHNVGNGGVLPPPEPYATVLTGGPIVDAVWRRLLDRAGPRPGVTLTDEPDLHLLVDGRRIDAMTQTKGVHVFRLPARPHEVRIVSRAGVPEELGTNRDPRPLGIALRRVSVRRGTRRRTMEACDARLSRGFHMFEPSNAFRWTDGDAQLPAPLFDWVDGACELVLQVGCTTQYPLFGDACSKVAA
jgi:hypothetical protein